MKINKVILTLLVVVGVVGIVVAVNWFKNKPVADVDTVAARTTGAAKAKVTIVEFIDFECPACANGYKLLKEYFAKYPNDLNIQVKYFPLVNAHRHAITSALYQECAARQGKFWELLDQVMLSQQSWSPLISADGMFREMAKSISINLEQLDACLVKEETREAIDDDRMLGQSLNIQSTPTYFVNNKMVVGSKSLQEELKQYFP